MYNCCDVSVMSSRLTLFLCMLCGSNSVRLSQPQELAVRPPLQERIMPAVKKIGVKFADKEKARQWRKYRAKPTQMLLFDVEQKVSGLAVRRKCVGPCREWTWASTGFKPFKKVFAKAAARDEKVGRNSKAAKLRPDVLMFLARAMPVTPPMPRLPILMQPALVESSDSEDCQELPARSDPYMAVRPKRPTCYAPSDAVCPGCTTGKPCPMYPPPMYWIPAPTGPRTPPGSPSSHVPHTAVGPHIPRTPPLTAQDPPTIPKLSERYRESIGSDSEHEREWYAIMPKC